MRLERDGGAWWIEVNWVFVKGSEGGILRAEFRVRIPRKKGLVRQLECVTCSLTVELAMAML